MVTALPGIAEAMAKSMGNARLNIFQGESQGGTPFKFILAELLDILRDRMEAVQKAEEE